MFFEEDKYQKNEKKILELDILLEGMEREKNELFQREDINPEELEDFLQNSDNFSAKTWEFLQSEKAKCNAEILQLMVNRASHRQSAKSRQEQGAIPPHWIPIK